MDIESVDQRLHIYGPPYTWLSPIFKQNLKTFTVIVVQLLSHVWLFVTPWPIACHIPLSMEFSRQEYWRGLPFPSPEDLPNPGIEVRSPALQADSLLSEPPRKPKNPGVGSLSLLWGVFMTQESDRDLLHCRRILYQLSYQGSPGSQYLFVRHFN